MSNNKKSISGKHAVPRILLLTLRSSGARYGTGEVLRRIVSCMPEDRMRWACLSSKGEKTWFSASKTKVFPSRILHWRLKAGLWQYIYKRIQAKAIARNIFSWVNDFDPEVLWVVPGADCVIVARHLENMLKIPVHLTVHDAFEIDQVFMRHSYLYGVLHNDIKALMEKVVTLDTVSPELIDYVKLGFKTNFSGTMAFPPSTDVSALSTSLIHPAWDNNIRRIGLCGNPRVEQYQWDEFVDMLSKMPFSFEIHVFGNTEVMLESEHPSNVRLIKMGFAENEEDILRHFRSVEVSVCYLGLYREKKQSYFVRTSLSSKLTTYVAAGCPVCVDGPEDSVGWRLVSEYDAGVIVNSGPDGVKDLFELLSDKDVWKRKSEGARRLCATEMDLEKNTNKLMALMTLASKKKKDA